MTMSTLLANLGLSGKTRVALPLHTAALAQFSNLASTAFKRHLQTLHESGDRRNPDILAGAFLSEAELAQCFGISAAALAAVRVEPYYHYLTARTKAYDQALLDAVVAGVRRVVLVGSGFDTRFHRFGGVLATHDIDVAECDQTEAIAKKRISAAALPYASRVTYFGIDLNQAPTCVALWDWLAADKRPALVMAEGVSPYVEATAFDAFLAGLADRLPLGSRLVYDFKLSGVADDFGKSASVASPFRMLLDPVAILDKHRHFGFDEVAVTTSRELLREHVPSWSEQVSTLFVEDALIRATR